MLKLIVRRALIAPAGVARRGDAVGGCRGRRRRVRRAGGRRGARSSGFTCGTCSASATGPRAARRARARGARRLGVAVRRDLPARARTRSAYERDLRTSIARFQQAAEAIPDGIVVLDAADRIEWANPRALAQLGLDLAHDRRPADRQPRAPAGVPALPRGRRFRRRRSSSRRARRRTHARAAARAVRASTRSC